MSYSLTMEGKSLEELHDYINNYQKYVPDAIEAAVLELKNRGEVFTLEELAEIKHRIEIRVEAVKEMEGYEPVTVNSYEAPSQQAEPELYTQPAIFGFTFFFSIITGAILLSINLKKLGKIREINVVMLTSVAYLLLASLLFAGLAGNMIVSMVFNVVGGIILTQFFWKKYIGDINYKRRQVWIPLVICLVIFVSISVWLITSGQYPIKRP
jgi:hypothetical protein